MSTLRTTKIQHPSSPAPNIELNADGTVALPLSNLEDLQNVSGTPSAGDALVYDGNEWVPHAPSGNLVINGAMQVHQRGTSVASITTGGYFTADRYDTTLIDSVGTWTQTVENDAPTGSGFVKSVKMECTAAQASLAGPAALVFRQFLEGQNLQMLKKGTSDAESLTLSFWVKSNVTGTYFAEFFDGPNDRQNSVSYTISSANTWEKKTLAYAGDTTGAIANTNATGLSLQFWLGAGSDRTSGTLTPGWNATVSANRLVGQTNLAAAVNNYWQVTGVQLETGAVATPFQFEDFGTTLAKCQRYFHNPGAVSGSYVIFNSGNFKSDSFYFPVTMRAAPSISVFDAAGNAGKISIQNAGGSDQVNITPPAHLGITTNSWYYAAGGITATTGTNGHLILLKYFANAEL